MSETWLFINEKKSFITNAMVDILKKENYLSITSDFESENIIEKAQDANIIFVTVEGNTLLEFKDGIDTLRDIAGAGGKTFFAFGDQENVDGLTAFVGEEHFWESFYRPISAKDMCTIMLESLSLGETVGRKRVLAVDDSGTYLHTLKSWLGPIYKTAVVNSAMAALAYMAKSGKPDLLLLDYEMPICSGTQMFEMLKADPQYADIPVVFLTGKSDKDTIIQVLALKPHGYLLKSLPKDKILESIENYFKEIDEKKKTEQAGE